MREILDKLGKNFEKGGKLESQYALYEAADTFSLYARHGYPQRFHVRDG